jgi:hypothetical protein
MRVSNERFSVWVMLTIFSMITFVTLSTNAQSIGPWNDMFHTPTVIENRSGNIQGSNVEATLEPSEPASCATCKTVWYSWTAPANLSMTFELVMQPVPPDNHLSDTVMGVYMGNDVSSLTMLASNDDISADIGNHRSRVTFIANAGGVYNIRVYGGNGSEGSFTLQWEINGAESWKQYNFDGCSSAYGGHKSEFAIFRPSDGSWWLNAESSTYRTILWGLAGDIPVSADYYGDGCSDVAIWRPSDGYFWIFDLQSGRMAAAQWGIPGDIPVRGDFDGDDKADLAIFRPSTFDFWILNSSDGSVRVGTVGYCSPGQCTPTPITGDYDGDGKTDIGLMSGYFGKYTIDVIKSFDGTHETYEAPARFAKSIPGDFDHDGKNDMAVYGLDNTFYYRQSSDGVDVVFQWGLPGDIPVSGDYNGMQGSDLCIWRPSDGNLYCHDPIEHRNWQYRWGIDGDKPIAAPAF